LAGKATRGLARRLSTLGWTMSILLRRRFIVIGV